MKVLRLLPFALVLNTSIGVWAQQECRQVVQPDAATTVPRPLFHLDTKSNKVVVDLTKSEVVNKAITYAAFNLLRMNPIHEVVSKIANDPSSDHQFKKMSRALNASVVRSAPLQESLNAIPKTGGLAIIGNHNVHGVEGIAILEAITDVRPDTKIVLTHYLSGLNGLPENAFFLNPYGGSKARVYNKEVMQNGMVPYVRDQKGAIFMYPSGEVGHKATPQSRPVEEVWKPGLARLIEEAPETQVILAYTPRETSKSWYRLRRIAELERTGKNKFTRALGTIVWKILPLFHVKEFGRTKEHREFEFGLSSPIQAAELLARFKKENGEVDRMGMMNFLRAATFSMHDRLGKFVDTRELQPIWQPAEEAVHKQVVADTLKQLDTNPLSVRGGVDIFNISTTDTSSALFWELGRLREKVFRTVGEGSGKPIDIDAKYDSVYNHLIALDSKSNTMLGSYRMGRLDRVETGYNEEFFAYSPTLKAALRAQGLEFGRSFVDKSAGKKALMAFRGLWEGIGRFIAENPHYRYMVGPVSISNTYSHTAKKVMVGYLMKFHMHPEKLAKARVPFETTLSEYEKILVDSIKNFKDLEHTIKVLDGAEVPPLLGIYSSLRGRYLDFSVDKDFNTVDGMILVDMHEMINNPELQAEYAKYMTAEGVAKYLEAQQSR